MGNKRDTRPDPTLWPQCTLSDDNVASPISTATKSVAPNTTPARAHFPDCLAMTARKSATSRKPTAPKRSNIQVKPDEKAQGATDPIVITESEDAPAPSRSKQSQRNSSVPQLKPTNGSAKGKGTSRGLQRDDPIDLEPLDDVSNPSDVEMSIPAPRPRSSPNEVSPAPVKDEALQRKLLQVRPCSRGQSSLGAQLTLLQNQKTIESLRKQIDELLKVQTDQQQVLESWKARQEASNGGTSSQRIIQRCPIDSPSV